MGKTITGKPIASELEQTGPGVLVADWQFFKFRILKHGGTEKTEVGQRPVVRGCD